MIIECKVADTSSIVNKTVGEVQDVYKVRIIHLHEGLPVIDLEDPLKFRVNPSPNILIPKGYYIKFRGFFENAIKLAKAASSS